MRKSLTRAVALASATPALAGVLAAGAPAAHATHTSAPTCGLGSTVLADFYLLGGLHTRIATYDVSPTVRNVCLELAGSVQTVIVVKSNVSLTPPSVSQTTGTGWCAQRIVDMTAPLTLSLSAGVSTTGPALCIGQDGVTTTISLNSASVQALPDLDVWTLRNTALNTYAACSDEYARYLAGLDDGYDYTNCRASDNHVL